MSQAVYYGQELINQNHLILNKTLELLVSKYSNRIQNKKLPELET